MANSLFSRSVERQFSRKHQIWDPNPERGASLHAAAYGRGSIQNIHDHPAGGRQPPLPWCNFRRKAKSLLKFWIAGCGFWI